MGAGEYALLGDPFKMQNSSFDILILIGLSEIIL
jgi:hypothetical protein